MSNLIPPIMPDDLDALIQAMERVQQLEAQVARLRLTDEEKKGTDGIIRDFQVIAEFNEERCHPHYAQKARCRVAMLSGLLKRLG